MLQQQSADCNDHVFKGVLFFAFILKFRLICQGSIEDAKYVWQMCVDHHQFYRIGDSKKDICGEEETR